ncbi:Na+/H+ antiporter subunit E [Lysinibacillus sp. FSL M8-0216]|uniref:Multisubunit sodium/proton antiporter, MrpE subunit n=1 Tax=Lysinibacillus fusiformis TaxID=28031 RepID=A0A1H9J7W5_9BACI|nr:MULTISPECIES: Na+/H+ antiporter subunit E [Lysinibacillus]EAZ85268.1 MrpE [Bacillus sp. B14905]MCG7437717.1 Na+/H+ antiporter subunit E [Lysinibacillus fusiformis]MED4075175.1 Na+/H+ antiporter subunit E [Lysinibacillus fusiformis]MED4669100.1 Na+/H+ antiporter subunit E [Lysinibacillus fusiformis]NOG30448.1 Na+/H+ antiporter subunit E [Lysinibacillus fusiformis]
MAFQMILNFVLAFVWMFLSSNYTATGFIIGFLMGIILLIIMRRFFRSRLYVYRLWALLKLTLLFFKELVLANVQVLKVVLKPKLDMQPAFFAYPTVLTEDWEITLLSSLITLTPGTVVVHVSDDAKTLYVHAIDINDVDEAVASIRDSFEKAILEVSKS